MRAAFLDLDGTLLDGCSSALMLRELVKDYRVDHRYAHNALMAADRKEKKGPSTLRGGIYKNLPLAVKGVHHSVIAEAAQAAQDSTREALFPFARDLVEMLRDANYVTFLVTGALWQTAAPVAEHLGIDVCIGAFLEVENQSFTGRFTRAPARSGEKRALVRSWAVTEGIDLSDSLAMGNGIRDAEMLELVGRPVAFEPEYDLEPLAHKNNWPIADRHTVLTMCAEMMRG